MLPGAVAAQDVRDVWESRRPQDAGADAAAPPARAVAKDRAGRVELPGAAGKFGERDVPRARQHACLEFAGVADVDDLDVRGLDRVLDLGAVRRLARANRVATCCSWPGGAMMTIC
jgi:hypothetical protein